MPDRALSIPLHVAATAADPTSVRVSMLHSAAFLCDADLSTCNCNTGMSDTRS
jgi:hypothetical protein